MKTKIYIGIDPGASGGIAAIQHGTYPKQNERVKWMMDTWAWKDCHLSHMVLHHLTTVDNGKNIIRAWLENVHAFPTDGRSSAFKFGMNFGMWKGLLHAHLIDFQLVVPQLWMNEYLRDGEKLPKEKKDRKNKLKEWAIEIATNLHYEGRVTLKTADAILIANCLSNKNLPTGEQIWLKE